MTIIEKIIDEFIKLVQENKIDFIFDREGDYCGIWFSQKNLIIRNYFNRYENSFYYQLTIFDKETERKAYNFIIEFKNVVYPKVDRLYKLIEERQYEGDDYLKKTLDELKSQKFDRVDISSKIKSEQSDDDLPVFSF